MHADFRFPTFFLAVLAFFSSCSAFYIPGWSIKTFKDGDSIPLFYNKIFSDNTQLQFAYADLPFVCPSSGRKHGGSRFTSGTSITLNLGEVLRGDRIIISDYELAMGEDQEIAYLCSIRVDAAGLQRARQLIRDRYMIEWIVDNLPGSTSFVTMDNSRKYYAAGFKLGYEEVDQFSMQPRYFLNNHVTMVIRYREAPGRAGENGKKVIIGFEIYPKSIEAGNRNSTTSYPVDLSSIERGLELNSTLGWAAAGRDEASDSNDDGSLIIPYTYSVYFREEDSLDWANRWDMYFVHQEENSKIHWLAIINSLIISGLLTAVVAVIFTRTIRGDIKGYVEIGLEEGKMTKPKRPRVLRSPRKSMDKSAALLDPVDADDVDVSSDDESLEEITGWKLVHGDVFRAPHHGPLLATLVGSGSQLVFMAIGLLLLSCFGVLNPSYRGGFISAAVALFVFAGLCSGYFSSRVYKTFGGQLWQHNVIVTGTLFPGLVFITVFILNLFVWAQASSTAIPFGTLIALLALWLLIQLPLVYVGGWFGFIRMGAWEHPVRPNLIPRQIPAQSWYLKRLQLIMLAGFVPFAVIFIELLYLFKSLWQEKSEYYYVFGFLAVVSIILIITVVEVTIVAVYFQLCSENYHWWWQSFFIGGSSSLWIFAYCVWYYFIKLHIRGFVSSMLFFSYSFLACAVYGLLTGTIGFLAAYAFVRRIYAAIKAD